MNKWKQEEQLKNIAAVRRAGLRPMQLHWPRAYGGPAPCCLGSLFIFARYCLHSRIVETAY